MKYSIICIIGTLYSLTLFAAGFASDDPYKEALADAQASLETSKAVLQGEDGWQPEDMERYLYDALSMIYLAKTEANRTFDPAVILQTNDDLTKLVDLGYLNYWPGDPLDDWEPIQVVDRFSGFTPNAIVVEQCPANYQTTVGGQPCPMSINIYIYGPDAALSSISSSLSILYENKEWASPPDGALYALSFYAQSDRQRQEIREKYKQEQQGQDSVGD